MKEQGTGHIINIVSRSGKIGFVRDGIYGASKFGLVGLNESLYREVAAAGIRVTAICPSWTNTEMAQEADTPLAASEMIQPADIVQIEHSDDADQIREVNSRAFGQAAEAEVVDRLRQTCPTSLSLVAVWEERIVGHILFTPAVIEAKERTLEGMDLAPLAVLPEFQRQGIGSKLVQAGLAEMRHTRQPFVIVLGHPEYYPRFGSVRAAHYGIRSEYDAMPEEAFMILVHS